MSNVAVNVVRIEPDAYDAAVKLAKSSVCLYATALKMWN